MSDSANLQMAIDQITAARRYTKTLLEDIDQNEWFRQPVAGINHVAWQIGHLAMAQYGLVLFRQRGRKLEDTELMSSAFRKKFSRGTTPNQDPDFYPMIEEIHDVFERVYRQSMEELATYPLEQLNDPVEDPYAAYPTKLGCLIFCAHHEMLHAGQVGMLRRLLGNDPIR